MPAAKYLLDSTILIDHLNGVRQAREWLSRLEPEDAKISAITRAEVLARATDQWEAVQFFLEEYHCLSLGAEEADIAAVIRDRFHVKLPDAFQAALAKNEELVLVTRDADFKKITDLEVKIPYHI